MRSPLPAVDAARAEIRRARPLLGTVVEIGLCAAGPEGPLHAAIDAAFAAIERVQALMSYHDPDSELSRLNRDAVHGARQVDAHTYRVLQAALRLARSSGGAFDPCVAPQLESWGYLPHGDGKADAAASWRDVELTADGKVRFLRPLRLDLGGIAKGYAVDLAVQSLQTLERADIIVNAGGDLRVAGAHPQTIHLRHPRMPAAAAHQVSLHNAALATSAAYFSRRCPEGRLVSALVNPRSQEPYVGNRSITVRAADCMTADALTKVTLFAAGSIAARSLSECGAQAFILEDSPPVEGRVAAGERRARLRQPVLVPGAPVPEVKQAVDRIQQFEQLQAP
jgi:thiamine biosynthesis lipoprotein